MKNVTLGTSTNPVIPDPMFEVDDVSGEVFVKIDSGGNVGGGVRINF